MGKVLANWDKASWQHGLCLHLLAQAWTFSMFFRTRVICWKQSSCQAESLSAVQAPFTFPLSILPSPLEPSVTQWRGGGGRVCAEGESLNLAPAYAPEGSRSLGASWPTCGVEMSFDVRRSWALLRARFLCSGCEGAGTD